MDLREVMEFLRDRAQLRSNARSRFERRPSQPVSHAVALAGPMIPSLPALRRGSYVRSTHRARSTAYITAIERIACNRAQCSDLVAH
jgi:hypothetical protein